MLDKLSDALASKEQRNYELCREQHQLREQQGVPQLKLKQRGRAVVVEPVVLDRDTRRSVKSPKAMEEQIRAEYVAGLKEVQKARSVYVIDADGRSALPLVNRLHGLGVGQSRAVEGGVANLIREGYALEGDVAYRSGSLKVFADRVEGLKDQATARARVEQDLSLSRSEVAEAAAEAAHLPEEEREQRGLERSGVARAQAELDQQLQSARASLEGLQRDLELKQETFAKETQRLQSDLEAKGQL